MAHPPRSCPLGKVARQQHLLVRRQFCNQNRLDFPYTRAPLGGCAPAGNPTRLG
jgi:hypothetical protein